MSYEGVDGFVSELGATVRECIDCGALIAGGPTRCIRCAKEGPPSGNNSVPPGPQPSTLKRIIILLLFPLYRRRYLRYRDAAWAQGYAAMSYEMWFRDVRPISY